MAVFPKIDSPCPYKANLAAIMDGSMCRMCKREVVDITALDERERRSFLASCEGEVCVSFRLPVKPALVAAAMAAAVAALPAAAQDTAAPVATTVVYGDDTVGYEEDETIIVGGINDPKSTAQTEDAADANLPEMPVIIEGPVDMTKPTDPVSGS